MSESGGQPTEERAAPKLAFANFLEDSPPSLMQGVSDLFGAQAEVGGVYFQLKAPDLQLHCLTCEGVRYFRYLQGDRAFRRHGKRLDTFLIYKCSNCSGETKTFSIVAFRDDDESNGRCYKFGELPQFGSPTPNRVLKLFGKDSPVFLKGRQCENHNLGIGAFAYYRRVVENHKNQILDEIIRVAKLVASELVPALEKAKTENQFLKAMESVKDGIPQALRINGHNPLTLLHSALSKGLHADTDEECLALAHDVRLVLTELTDRIGQAMKDEAELNAAVSRLMKPKKT